MTVGHLEYYTRHGLNPVRYDTTDLTRHLQRRASLYRTLGIPPLAIRGAQVLEVAAGSGQNSLYLARQGPAELTLVEPNPVARADIAAVYADPAASPVRPRVVAKRLEEFDPPGRYDLVVCENWLGGSPPHRRLLRKLAGFVADGGLLVVTAVPPVGILANVLRRALARRLTRPSDPFTWATDRLCHAFGPHLRTLAGMTRSITDWVHDNMLNPAYWDVILPLPVLVGELAGGFDVLGTSPRFATEWRWFKELHGPRRDFNGRLLTAYFAEAHNFLDYRRLLPPRDPERNRELEAAAATLADAVRDWEAGRADTPAVTTAVRQVADRVGDLGTDLSEALDEFLAAFTAADLTPEDVAALPRFGPLFGRETVYVAFEKHPRL